MDDERLLRSPRNALGATAMHRKDGDSRRYLVLARLDWGSCIEIVPAEVTWTAWDRVQVEWTARGASRSRRTWLLKSDIVRRLRLRA